MRIAVFREAEDGARTAEALTRLGHQAILAPVIEIVATNAPIPASPLGAVVFTSAHAPQMLGGDPRLAELVRLPCWCVGTRTAAAATAAGFKQTIVGPGDARRLASALAETGPTGQVLFVTGRDRKPDLEQALGESAHPPIVMEAYDARPISSWLERTIDELQVCEAALHYSRRSAALALSLADKAGLTSKFAGWQHVCLSADVARPLRDRGIAEMLLALEPTERSLMSLVGPAPMGADRRAVG